MRETFYSEVLDKHFDSKAECLKAEDAYEKKKLLDKKEKEEKRLAAKEVEEAFKLANEKYKEANKKMSEFVEKYGSFHYSFTDSNLPANSSLFDFLFKDFFW